MRSGGHGCRCCTLSQESHEVCRRRHWQHVRGGCRRCDSGSPLSPVRSRIDSFGRSSFWHQSSGRCCGGLATGFRRARRGRCESVPDLQPDLQSDLFTNSVFDQFPEFSIIFPIGIATLVVFGYGARWGGSQLESSSVNIFSKVMLGEILPMRRVPRFMRATLMRSNCQP